MVKPVKTTACSPTDILQENKTEINHEPSAFKQPAAAEPKWIDVEDLQDYYANSAPLGRKHPAQTQYDFENLYIDGSFDEIQNNESEPGESKEAGDNKEAAKLTKEPTIKSRGMTEAEIEAKADLIIQAATGSEDEEESSEEDEEKQEPRIKKSNGRKYRSCDTCTWAKVKCVPGKMSNKDGDKMCLECEERGRRCHFSIKGERPAKP